MAKIEEHSKISMFVIALAIAVMVSFFYQNGIMRKAELATLDLRFLINSITPRAVIAYKPHPGWFGGKELAAQFDSWDENVPGIVLIDMPETENDITSPASAKDYEIAAKILFGNGARAVVINSVLPAPSPEKADASHEEVIALSEGVYLPVFYDADKSKAAFLYSGIGVSGALGLRSLFIANGAGIGHVNAFADADGKLRRVPAVIGYNGKATYQLGLKVGFDMLGIKDDDISLDPKNHAITFAMPDQSIAVIPLDKDNQLIINWGAIEKKAFSHFSYKDIVESYRLTLYNARPSIDPKLFDGAICFLGAATSNAAAGVPVHLTGHKAPAIANASVAMSVLRRSFVREVPAWCNIALIFFMAMFVGISLFSRPVLNIMMVVVVTAAVIGLTYNYWLSNVTYLLLAIAVAIPFAIFLARFRVFSGLLLTIFSIAWCLIFSAGIFKLFNLVVSAFYPMLAAILVFTSFYSYTELIEYLKKLQLFNLATKDGLTGLYNRRQLNLLIESEIGNAVLRKTKKLSLVMCDIDNFKKLNDTYGHQAGDMILKEFAKIMRSKCRQADVVARYGGEEFVFILSGAGRNEAFKVADGIRQAVSEKKFIFKGKEYSTSMSMGIVEYTKEKTKEEFIEKADQALYKAKKQGKNCVVISE